MHLSRRAALLGLTSAVTFGRASLALAAAPTQQRLVVVLLRGALDGLAAVVPYGDPNLARHRAELIPGAVGTEGGMLDLGGYWGLHPALAGLHGMYPAGELLPIHAVAGPYRSRSHFEAQDLLESGTDHRLTSGWLNRAVQAMPASDAGETAMAVGVSLPLLLRGAAPVGAYAPPSFAKPQPELYARLAALTRPDPVLGPAVQSGLKERGFSATQLRGEDGGRDRYAFSALAGTAGRLLAAADGPRVAALELGGWDTHAYQAGRLNSPLGQLAAGLVALREGLGDAWRQSAVLVMTEFGRTVRMNGTRGTDHGTATVAFLAGGAVAGGRVLANWPGLSDGNLLEDRDLQPTMDARALAKGVLAGHLGLTGPVLARVFPDSTAATAATGLLRS